MNKLQELATEILQESKVSAQQIENLTESNEKLAHTLEFIVEVVTEWDEFSVESRLKEIGDRCARELEKYNQ